MVGQNSKPVDSYLKWCDKTVTCRIDELSEFRRIRGVLQKLSYSLVGGYLQLSVIIKNYESLSMTTLTAEAVHAPVRPLAVRMFLEFSSAAIILRDIPLE